MIDCADDDIRRQSQSKRVFKPEGFQYRHRRTGKDFSIGGRAILTRTQSSDAIIQRDIKMRELEHAEARGVNNKTFSEIYEEHDGRPHDLEDGSFMVDNPQIALRKHSQEYMREVGMISDDVLLHTLVYTTG